jgi:hypothetical protein
MNLHCKKYTRDVKTNHDIRGKLKFSMKTPKFSILFSKVKILTYCDGKR